MLVLKGKHRLLCGDSTSQDQVERLMDGEKADMVFTDPPYGMNLDTDYTKKKIPKGSSSEDAVRLGKNLKKYKPVQGDDSDYDPQQLLSIFKNSREFFIWGVDYFHNRIPNGGSFIVWDKRNDELETAVGNDFELCWSREHHKRLVFRKLWSGFTARERSEIRVHPTQKPIALSEWFFERWGKPADLVIDLFLGSGSTLIACEKTGRRCFGMEIDPHYCDVIIERYKKFCGKEVVKG